MVARNAGLFALVMLSCDFALRSWLHFGESAWDLWFVYEANFVREVKSILTDGFPGGQLQLQPVSRPEQPDQLSWGLCLSR